MHSDPQFVLIGTHISCAISSQCLPKAHHTYLNLDPLSKRHLSSGSLLLCKEDEGNGSRRKQKD